MKTFGNRHHIFVVRRTENVQYSGGIPARILADRPDGTGNRALDAYGNGASQIALVVILKSFPGRLLSCNQI
jgi:hypothetical protein